MLLLHLVSFVLVPCPMMQIIVRISTFPAVYIIITSKTQGRRNMLILTRIPCLRGPSLAPYIGIYREHEMSSSPDSYCNSIISLNYILSFISGLASCWKHLPFIYSTVSSVPSCICKGSRVLGTLRKVKAITCSVTRDEFELSGRS